MLDADGMTQVVLRNAQGDQGASVRWGTSSVPYFIQWKNTVAPEDGYVTGLEPGDELSQSAFFRD